LAVVEQLRPSWEQRQEQRLVGSGLVEQLPLEEEQQRGKEHRLEQGHEEEGMQHVHVLAFYL
jgi:hypothetical protein